MSEDKKPVKKKAAPKKEAPKKEETKKALAKKVKILIGRNPHTGEEVFSH